jgi:methionyl-tRNA formyltransferase
MRLLLMNVVFAGTPEFSVPALQALLDSKHVVVAVYTQPDRPSGRGRRTMESPVKRLAQKAKVPVFQPPELKSAGALAMLQTVQPDLMVVVAYGLILPPGVLRLPRLGCVNLHASLLPRWRGAAPIQRAILAGDTETGVCLMQMDAGLDTGPLLACQRCEIGKTETGSQLHDKLAQLGAALLADNLDALERGALRPQPQDESVATYARKLDKSEALIDWSDSAADIARKVRAFNAWPVAETRYRGRQLRIWEARPRTGEGGAVPGTVISSGRDGFEVACGAGRLLIKKVQLPGARVVSAADFINANSLEGICLGDD